MEASAQALRERVEARTTKTSTKCQWWNTLAGLDEDLRNQILDFIESDISSNVLSDSLHDIGIHAPSETIRRHRQNACQGCRSLPWR